MGVKLFAQGLIPGQFFFSFISYILIFFQFVSLLHPSFVWKYLNIFLQIYEHLSRIHVKCFFKLINFTFMSQFHVWTYSLKYMHNFLFDFFPIALTFSKIKEFFYRWTFSVFCITYFSYLNFIYETIRNQILIWRFIKENEKNCAC